MQSFNRNGTSPDNLNFILANELNDALKLHKLF